MDVIFKQRAETVAQKLEQPSLDAGLKLQASERLREIRSDQRAVLTQDGRETFVLQYLQREATRYQADDATLATLEDADEPRTRPLCTCPDSGCALKEGRLPVVVQDAESLQRGIREFRHTHIGEPVVLDDAAAELDSKVEHVMAVYDIVLIALSNRMPVDEVERMQDGDEAESESESESDDVEANANANADADTADADEVAGD